MAVLSIPGMWINAADDPSTAVFIQQVEWPTTTSYPVEVRATAAGGARAIIQAGASATTTVTIPAVDLDTYRRILDLAAATVVIRDGRGFRSWAVITDVTGEPDRVSQVMATVDVTFRLVSGSEAI